MPSLSPAPAVKVNASVPGFCVLADLVAVAVPEHHSEAYGRVVKVHVPVHVLYGLSAEEVVADGLEVSTPDAVQREHYPVRREQVLYRVVRHGVQRPVGARKGELHGAAVGVGAGLGPVGDLAAAAHMQYPHDAAQHGQVGREAVDGHDIGAGKQYAHRRRSACRRAPERAHGPLPPGALYAAVNGVLQPGRDLDGVVFHLACIHFHFSPFSR